MGNSIYSPGCKVQASKCYWKHHGYMKSHRRGTMQPWASNTAGYLLMDHSRAQWAAQTCSNSQQVNYQEDKSSSSQQTLQKTGGYRLCMYPVISFNSNKQFQRSYASPIKAGHRWRWVFPQMYFGHLYVAPTENLLFAPIGSWRDSGKFKTKEIVFGWVPTRQGVPGESSPGPAI